MTQRRVRPRSGAAMLEGALVMVAFVFLLVGIFEVSRLRLVASTLEYAASEGCRYAMVHGRDSSSPATNASITSIVRSKAMGMRSQDISVQTTWNPDNRPGSQVTVSLRYTFQSVLTLLTLSAPISARSTVRIQH